jgi:hypothetical protein
MNTAIRIALAVAALVAVGGAGTLVFLIFQTAAGCAAGKGAGEVLQHAVVNQAPFLALGYCLLSVGYFFGVRAVVRRQWHVPTKPHHLFIATALATASVVLLAAPFVVLGGL